MTDGERHCFDLVRAADKDRFLASLFAPDGKRPQLLALYAFNIEIARVRETVSDPRLGEIRHQWWRDALDSIYAGSIPDHPVAQELARAIETGDLPKTALANMISARQFELYDDPMPTFGDLEGYLGETSSALIQMAALILAGSEVRSAAAAAGLGGVAFGLAGLMRSLPLHRVRGQCFVPRDLLERHGSSPAELIAGRETAGIVATLAQLRDVIAIRLKEARALRKEIPSAALPAFLHVGLTDFYLARLGRLGPRCLTEIAEVAQWRKQICLFQLGRTWRF